MFSYYSKFFIFKYKHKVLIFLLPYNEDNPYKNSTKLIFPSPLESKTLITLFTKGFWANSGTSKNSSGSNSPL